MFIKLVVVAVPDTVRPPVTVPLPIVEEAVITNPELVDTEVPLMGVNGHAKLSLPLNAFQSAPVKQPVTPEEAEVQPSTAPLAPITTGEFETVIGPPPARVVVATPES